ncbi:hypothetical protein [Algoriphagus resistens]|uniref:hypothetical protein n=1 Tax=Algoriphagus resistens TaxID=1750590 RepID=UPI000716B107|nr:hypothetical protein [Algoriphagus resistens]
MVKNFTLLGIAFSVLIGFTPDAVGQTTTFDVMDSNVGSQKRITWNTSTYGSGFGHRIINIDPGNSTTLNFQARHNSATWKDVFVINTLGNVGLGLSIPAYPFHLKASATARSRFEYGTSTIDIVDYGSGSLGYSGSAGVFVNGTDALFMSGPSKAIRMVTNDGSAYYERMRILSNGNVGIGTVSPSEKLSVNGKIKAHEINLTTTGWPDYVFTPEYNLMPLSELEAFIQMNGHLPDVPTEAEVMENGINLAEMNVKLLEKVEELTLYILSQGSKIESQEKQIDNLLYRMEKIESNKYDK